MKIIEYRLKGKTKHLYLIASYRILTTSSNGNRNNKKQQQ